jgi:signal transduction histidine kinase
MDPGLGESTLRPEMKLHLLRIVQEALSNARRHGSAHQVLVTMAIANGCLRLTVEDDCCGFDAQETANFEGSQYGLGFMRVRAEELRGTMEVTSAPSSGTRVALEIPLDGTAPAENGRA